MEKPVDIITSSNVSRKKPVSVSASWIEGGKARFAPLAYLLKIGPKFMFQYPLVGSRVENRRNRLIYDFSL